ncbi:hypothetical protein [Halobaculum marinum]|uniref:Small CPxCG-related zinc finger protein n=1 Tax=Halobaculum marinum TaxID=3031996 RepID=A0ABD5X069_9EURY|nr:hypothetical protein [Halobaculum sp. DT55]
MLRRTHECDRCGADIAPGDEYAAVDGIAPDGEIRVLLCAACAVDFSRFLDGA